MEDNNFSDACERINNEPIPYFQQFSTSVPLHFTNNDLRPPLTAPASMVTVLSLDEDDEDVDKMQAAESLVNHSVELSINDCKTSTANDIRVHFTLIQ